MLSYDLFIAELYYHRYLKLFYIYSIKKENDELEKENDEIGIVQYFFISTLFF